MRITTKNLTDEICFWFSKSILSKRSDIAKYIRVSESMIEVFKLDFEMYYPDEKDFILDNLACSSELQGILLYRIARECFLQKNPICREISYLGRFLSGFEIYHSAEIGQGLKINHGLGTVIGARVKIGKNCLIHQNVTLGDRGSSPGRPIVGDNVVIYAGAKIIGDIRVSDNSLIGANAVCLKDVPRNSIAVGVPARILNNNLHCS